MFTMKIKNTNERSAKSTQNLKSNPQKHMVIQFPFYSLFVNEYLTACTKARIMAVTLSIIQHPISTSASHRDKRACVQWKQVSSEQSKWHEGAHQFSIPKSKEMLDDFSC